jgi:hypothetical protein
MKTELTTPKAILIGMSLIAVAIASIPYSKSVVTEAHAKKDEVMKIAICDQWGHRCAIDNFGNQKHSIRIPLDIYQK